MKEKSKVRTLISTGITCSITSAIRFVLLNKLIGELVSVNQIMSELFHVSSAPKLFIHILFLEIYLSLKGITDKKQDNRAAHETDFSNS